MRYFVFLALILSGCTSCYDAQVAQANAQAAQAQAAIIQAQEQARMFQQFAESSKPVYWPIVVLAVVAVVALLLVVRWHMITVTHVAAGRPVQSQQLLLPGQAGFNEALFLAAEERQARISQRDGVIYLIEVSGQRTPVRQLTVRNA